MKRIIAVFFAIILCLSLSLCVFAGEYTVDGDGNAVYDTAIGYAIHIDDVNGVIEGEDATVINNNVSLNNVGSKWAIWFTAKKHTDGIYEVITDGAAMGGAIPSVTLGDDEIFVAVHSSSSRPTEADLYPNWEDKVAALAIKKGDFVAFHSDINVSEGVGSGLMIVLTKDDVLAGNIKFPENNDDPVVSTPDESVSEPDTDVSVPDEDVDTSAEQNENDATTSGSTTVIGGNSVDVSEYTIDIGDHADSSADDNEGDGISVWVWFGLALGAGVIVLIVAFVVVPKKKK